MYPFEGDLPTGLSLIFEHDFEQQLLPVKTLVIEVEIVLDRVELLGATYSWRTLDNALQHGRCNNIQTLIVSSAVADMPKGDSVATRVEATVRTVMTTCNTRRMLEIYVTGTHRDTFDDLTTDTDAYAKRERMTSLCLQILAACSFSIACRVY